MLLRPIWILWLLGLCCCCDCYRRNSPSSLRIRAVPGSNVRTKNEVNHITEGVPTCHIEDSGKPRDRETSHGEQLLHTSSADYRASGRNPPVKMEAMCDIEEGALPLLGKSRLLGMGSTMVELMMPNVYTERVEGYIKYIPEDFVVNEIDLNGNVVVARRTAHRHVAAMALQHERSRTSGESFLKLRKIGNRMGTMKYPATMFTPEDCRRLDGLLDELVKHMGDREGPNISAKNPPFCLVVLQESENPKELRTQVHAFIRENLPFLDSVAHMMSKLRDQEHADYVERHLSDAERADDVRHLIKVFPRPACVRCIQNVRRGPDDWVNDVLKDMPPTGMPTLKGVVSHLDLTDYSKVPPDSKERQKLKQYLHFNVQKRDRSTHEITHMLCRAMRRSSHDIFTAGNKDRRAVTTQRFCMRRAKIEDFVSAMTHPKWIDSVVVSDFHYSAERLRLGDLRGNTFWVTVRGVSNVQQALLNLESLRFNGFLNYFGLQRFGSLQVGTHVVGAAMLRRDYEDVARLIVNDETAMERYLTQRKAAAAREQDGSSPENPGADALGEEHQGDGAPGKKGAKRRREERYRRLSGDNGGANGASEGSVSNGGEVVGVGEQDSDAPAEAGGSSADEDAAEDPGTVVEADTLLKVASRSSFIERELLNGMERNKPIEEVLRRIPANVLSIYVHAAQSLVFNFVLTERLKKYGPKPVPGDFVIRSSQLPLTTSIEGEAAEGSPSDQEAAAPAGSEQMEQQAYVVSGDDLERWSLYDVVLPLPGDNVDYPEFLRPVYERVVRDHFGMSLGMFATVIDGLPPHLKGRERCLVGVGGGYRHVVARAHGLQYYVVPELAPSGALVAKGQSPYICLRNQLRRPAESEQDSQLQRVGTDGDARADYVDYKLATRSTLVVSCALPKSCYLTCALREVLADESLERQYIA